MISTKQLSQIWKESRSSRSFALELQTGCLSAWVAECIGHDIVENGESGEIRIPFLERDRPVGRQYLYCPDVMGFEAESQRFVTPCGSRFSPAEIIGPIGRSLGKSGVVTEMSMSGSTLVVRHGPSEASRTRKRGNG